MTTSIQSKNSTQSAILVNGVEAAVFDASGISGIAGLNGGQLAGMRNRIINGGMQVNQYGTPSVTAGGNYGPDRWITALTGATGITATSGISSITGASSGSAAYISGSWTAGKPLFAQRIEAANVADMGGKTVVLSGKYYQETGSSVGLTITLWKANTKDTFSAKTLIGTNTSTSIPSGTLTPFIASFTLAVGESLNGLQVMVETTSAVSVTSKTFYIGDVQLELGPVATPFEQRPYGLELALCQRYCQIPVARFINAQYGTYNSEGQALPLPVNMRATPTISGVTSYTIQGVTSAATGVTMVAAHNSIMAQWTGTNGLLDRQSALLSPNQQAVLSAEL